MTKKLVAYFSVGGVTKNVAEQVAKQVEGNLYEIRPMNPYSKRDLDYLDPMSRSTMEAANPKARPALADRDARVEDYDVVYVGFPIWWGLAPKLINSFLEAYDFRGKTVVPFATSSGSGIGDVSKYIAPSAPGATVTEGQLRNLPLLTKISVDPMLDDRDTKHLRGRSTVDVLSSSEGVQPPLFTGNDCQHSGFNG